MLFDIYRNYILLPIREKLRQFKRARRFYIGREGKVHLPTLEFYIVNGCNLKCEFCCHLNPYRKGFIPLEELECWFKEWSKKLMPRRVRLLGGEPFLHPQLIEVITAARKYWTKSDIHITTNGLLLSNLAEEKLNALQKLNILINVSAHVNDEESIKRTNEITKRLKSTKVRFRLKTSNKTWTPSHQLDEQGYPIPYQNNPTSAYRACSPKDCIPVNHNRLFRCSIIANAHAAYNEGALLSDQWSVVSTPTSLSTDASPKEMLEFITNGPVPECSICPVSLNYIESKQLNGNIKRKSA
jgi:organic radical activating enzyme